MRRHVRAPRNHGYELRSVAGRGKLATSSERAPGPHSKANNVGSGRITNFFALRKRRSGEEELYNSHGKKTNLFSMFGASTSSNQLVPDCLYDEKENSPPWEAEGTQVTPEVVLQTPLGLFQSFPRELLYAFFDRIPASQLKLLSLASKALSSKIRYYILLGSARQRFSAETSRYVPGPDLYNAHDPFSSWGKLLKASTITMNSRNRRAFLGSFFCKNSNITNWYGWGRCFMTFCEIWAFCECEELLRAVLQFTGLNDLLSIVLPAKVGKFAQEEIEIRERFQGFFFGCFKTNESSYGFWNSIILRTQKTIAHQGRLFMIIFGPTKTDENGCEVIDWELLCDVTIESRYLCQRAIGPLSLNLYHLFIVENLGKYAWSTQQIFSLIEEISTSPNFWTLDNFAALLVLRPELIHIALHTRIIHGHQEEAAQIFHAVKMVLHRWGIFASPAVASVMMQTFQTVPEVQRRLFLAAYFRIESERLSDALLAAPFLRDHFLIEVAAARAMAPLITLLTMNV